MYVGRVSQERLRVEVRLAELLRARRGHRMEVHRGYRARGPRTLGVWTNSVFRGAGGLAK